MRLLWIAHSLPPVGRRDLNIGGMQRVAEELMDSLGARPDLELHHRVLRSAARSMSLKTVPYLATLLWQIPRIVKQHHIDVVLFSSMVSGTLALPLSRKLQALGATTVAIAHGRDVTWSVRAYQRLLPRVFAALSGVIAVSHATGKACTARGLPDAKLDVVPNGVDLRRLSPAADRRAVRQELNTWFGGARGLSDETPLLVSVGRHVKRKGFGWFVREAFPRLPDNVHYWIAGSGPETAAIEREIANLGLRERVRVLGQITEQQLSNLYRGADLLIVPNRPIRGDLEGFGVVMLEAGMSGLPTVAAALDGISDVIADGQNGYLVRSGDPQAFAGVITDLLADPQARASLSRRAMHYTRQHFGWPTIADHIVRVLDTRRQRGNCHTPMRIVDVSEEVAAS